MLPKRDRKRRSFAFAYSAGIPEWEGHLNTTQMSTVIDVATLERQALGARGLRRPKAMEDATGVPDASLS